MREHFFLRIFVSGALAFLEGREMTGRKAGCASGAGVLAFNWWGGPASHHADTPRKARPATVFLRMGYTRPARIARERDFQC